MVVLDCQLVRRATGRSVMLVLAYALRCRVYALRFATGQPVRSGSVWRAADFGGCDAVTRLMPDVGYESVVTFVPLSTDLR